VLGVVYGLLTAVAYAGFLLLIREVGGGPTPAEIGVRRDAQLCRRRRDPRRRAGELDLEPDWPAHGWLFVLAVSARWWATCDRRLAPAPAVVASILLVQPVLTVILAAIVVDERPPAAVAASCSSSPASSSRRQEAEGAGGRPCFG
jgi:hypothetical protein